MSQKITCERLVLLEALRLLQRHNKGTVMEAVEHVAATTK
jgi:hypothetical protein